MSGCCSVPRCRGEIAIAYLDRDLCERHWEALNAEDASADRLRMDLGLPTGASGAMEDTEMSESEIAAEGAAQEEPMATKQKSVGTKKKGAKILAVKKAAQPKAKRQKIPAADLMTFAVRLPKSESAAFHQAAGPGKASRYARMVLAAFANGDEAAFRQALDEARNDRA